ncbi:MAG TPA: hypothetical protein DD490_30360 [Acidobacteria bacterium]|nr:hypothetical protein [Acidobacteriota bacterium]
MADAVDAESSTPQPAEVRPPVGNPYLAAALAWVIPGLGHIYVKRWRRGLAFSALVLAAIGIGWFLQGNLYRLQSQQPLSVLATLGAMGMGAPYFILRYGLGYMGDIASVGYEHGTAFLLTGGLMNLLLVLDAWDIALGKKD